MKQLKFIIIVTIFSILPCYAIRRGYVIEEVMLPTRTESNPLNFASDTQAYTTGIGGITFTYPVGWFNQPPIVQLAVQQDVAHPTSETFGAEIVSNSTTSTTVMVYEVNGGVVSEAPSGVVTVILLAIDNS
jgi:hypothetical protein